MKISEKLKKYMIENAYIENDDDSRFGLKFGYNSEITKELYNMSYIQKRHFNIDDYVYEVFMVRLNELDNIASFTVGSFLDGNRTFNKFDLIYGNENSCHKVTFIKNQHNNEGLKISEKLKQYLIENTHTRKYMDGNRLCVLIDDKEILNEIINIPPGIKFNIDWVENISLYNIDDHSDDPLKGGTIGVCFIKIDGMPCDTTKLPFKNFYVEPNTIPFSFIEKPKDDTMKISKDLKTFADLKINDYIFTINTKYTVPRISSFSIKKLTEEEGILYVGYADVDKNKQFEVATSHIKYSHINGWFLDKEDAKIELIMMCTDDIAKLSKCINDNLPNSK